MSRGGTPNMHAIQHLADCVLDYGPAHGWTCFAFERMNGTLKETSTNMRNVEETLIRVWTQRDYLQILPHLNGRWAKMTQGVRDLVSKMLGCQLAVPVCDLSAGEKAARELRLDVGAQFACVTLEHLRRRQPRGDDHEPPANLAPWISVGAMPQKPRAAVVEAAKAELAAAIAALMRQADRPGALRNVTGASVLCVRTSRHLRFFGDQLGTAASRSHRSSWVMVVSGRRTEPAQCLSFAEVAVMATLATGGTEQRTLQLVKLRYSFITPFHPGLHFSFDSFLLSTVSHTHIACSRTYRKLVIMLFQMV